MRTDRLLNIASFALFPVMVACMIYISMTSFQSDAPDINQTSVVRFRNLLMFFGLCGSAISLFCIYRQFLSGKPKILLLSGLILLLLMYFTALFGYLAVSGFL
ncbi:MAG: hypothetical protein KKA07_15745 [Bacteroidetes bacterium]|nr:hypothetical protein [Bacteroidota bacterium]MBU1720517.1 hypothetical protein [Bacteroidota bacterium]